MGKQDLRAAHSDCPVTLQYTPDGPTLYACLRDYFMAQKQKGGGAESEDGR